MTFSMNEMHVTWTLLEKGYLLGRHRSHPHHSAVQHDRTLLAYGFLRDAVYAAFAEVWKLQKGFVLSLGRSCIVVEDSGQAIHLETHHLGNDTIDEHNCFPTRQRLPLSINQPEKPSMSLEYLHRMIFSTR